MAGMEGLQPYESHTSDGMTVATNAETSEAIKANFESEAKPQDGEGKDEVSEAAKTLGKKGGEAAAKARAAKPAEEVEEAPEVEPEKPLGKPRHDPRARVAEATREAAEARRQLVAERAERERLAQELAQARAPKADDAPAKDPNAAPKLEDYGTHEEWVEATIDHRLKIARAQDEQRRYFESMAAAHANGVVRVVEGFKQRAATVSLDKVPDDLWDALVPSFNVDPREVGSVNVMADEILVSEQGPLMVAHFADHPEDFQRIASLQTPGAISRAVAKLEARLEAATTGTSPEPIPSKAKPPVRPVTGSPRAVDPDPENESLEDYVRRENAKELQARRGR